MVKRSCGRAIAFCCPIRAPTASPAEQWQPTACSKATMFGGGCHGSTAKARVASTALVNRWAPRWYWKACVPSPGSVPLSPILRSPISVVLPTIGKGYFVGAGRFRMERIVGRTVGLLPAEIGFLYARWRYGVDLRRANPVDAVKSSTVPVLLIHGEEDVNILPWHSRTLAQADPVHAQLWLVPGAGHCGAARGAPDGYGSRVLVFCARHNGARLGDVSYPCPTG